MNISTKFDLGDKVYYRESVRSESITIDVCKRCGGTGKLQIVDGSTISCDKCWGSGGAKSHYWTFKPSESPSMIGRIGVEIHKNPNKYNKDTEQYQLFATGIGTGTLHYFNEIFSTQQECQEYCDLKNEEALAIFKSEYPTAVFERK